MEFLEKLAALIPRSHVNLVLYHGVLAPHARWRPRVVLPEPPDPATGGHSISPDPSEGTRPAPRAHPRHWTWAQLMERAFGVDVLACPRCAGRLRLVATVDDPRPIRAILESLGLPTEVPQPDPGQPAPRGGGRPPRRRLLATPRSPAPAPPPSALVPGRCAPQRRA